MLALRALFFVVLLPGTVTLVIPFHVLEPRPDLHALPLRLSSAPPLVLVAIGAILLLWSVWEFFASGRGTLAPVDPPRHLVVSGLYRFTRNPMYNGVLLVLLGEAWLFRSVTLLVYAAVVLLLVHLFVVRYEERALETRFGDSYRAYRRHVPRWGFTTRPYEEGTGDTASPAPQ